jgi:uncharacterized protein YdiU (UPF0061 family)
MNTDNMSISGETIDYGPCAFMDFYDPRQVYSSIDEMGRYAYANQPGIAQWNLARLAETLLPLLGDNDEASLKGAQDALDTFAPRFEEAYVGGLRAKLGLREARDGDLALAQDLLQRMAFGHADFTLTFRKLADLLDGGGGPRDLFASPAEFDAWSSLWKRRLAEEGGDDGACAASMRAINPLYIPRNHLVEESLAAAAGSEDFSLFEILLAALSKPFDERSAFARFAVHPRTDQIVAQTFCGT